MSLKTVSGLALIAAAFVSVTAANAQEAAVETLGTQTATSGEDWHVVSRSSATVYMMNVNDIQKANGITSVKLARVPASGETSDLSHSIGQVDFRCSANQSRPGEEVIYGVDGAVEDRINDGYDFDRIPANSLDAYTKALACDDERSNQHFPSIRAFIEAGRPSLN